MSGSRTQPRPSRTPAPQMPQPQPFRPFTGGNLSPDSANGFGANFGEQQSTFNQSRSSQRQESSYSSTTRREDVKQSFESSRQAIEEYRTRTSTKLTLADCQLDLKLSILTITTTEVELSSNTLDLDDYVGNIGGELVWASGADKFTKSCESIQLQGTVLRASCSRDRDEFVQSELDLNEHIVYNSIRRCFMAIVPDEAFTELMSSANWMNFTNVIRSVAQRAVDEVMAQMKTVMMLAVEEAVSIVSARSEEYVQDEMETLIKMATKSAAYSGLGQLKMMHLEQRRAFNTFAPYISAPTIHEEEPSRTGR
ncbi:hypothetical protein C8J57DRAFT_1407631 [Mycena rebaudengoi]|nr:hypothetical protein C8J57DRAFT_1407631 [Mycena rebaudengoi]